MTLYHCLIDLRSDARALAFAAACGHWLGLLQDRGLVARWRLLRRTLGLASGPHSDFVLEIEMKDLGALADAFGALGQMDDDAMRRYDQFHQMIGRAEVGLYRPFPDTEGRERIALI
jgi:hypothetical protein